MAINEEIEELVTSIAPDASGVAEADGGGLEGPSLHGMDPFGRLVMKQRKLLEASEALVSQIQALQGFENFLKATPSSRSCVWLRRKRVDNDERSRSNIGKRIRVTRMSCILSTSR